MESVQKYLLQLVTVCFLCAVVQALIPKGAVKRVVCVGCGLLLVLTALRPVAHLDLEDLARSISRWNIQASETESGIRVDNQQLISAIIKENCETYIWDKAAVLGFEPKTVEVEIKEDGGYPYPCKVSITGAYTAGQKQQLADWIQRELAIKTENQEWTWN